MHRCFFFTALCLFLAACGSTQEGMPLKQHEKINYVELPAVNIEATKAFFTQVFGWSFTDYGPDYADTPAGGLMIGFYTADLTSTYATGGGLITLYSEDLEGTLEKIKSAGGVVTQPIFSFPGGRRFHFSEPSGNELAVWSDKGIE